MWQAGSPGSACSHSPLLSGDADTCPVPRDKPDPPSNMRSHRPAVPRNSLLCTHAITHTNSRSRNLNIPDFSQSQTCMPLFPSPLAAQTQLHASPTHLVPLPTASLCAPGNTQPLIQYDLHCSWPSVTLPSSRGLAEEEAVGSRNCQAHSPRSVH